MTLAPRERREDLVEGETRVDASRGVLLVLEGRPAKLPAFADRADMRVEFDAATPTGDDASRLTLAGEGGLLFIRKRLRVVTRMAYGP